MSDRPKIETLYAELMRWCAKEDNFSDEDAECMANVERAISATPAISYADVLVKAVVAEHLAELVGALALFDDDCGPAEFDMMHRMLGSIIADLGRLTGARNFLGALSEEHAARTTVN